MSGHKENGMKHVGWWCRTCNKIDLVDSSTQLAKSNHISHRGIDIGDCDGKMIKFYVKINELKENCDE
jgi:hypothetical protein